MVVAALTAVPPSPNGGSLWKRFTALDSDRTQATALMQRRRLADCERAVELLEQSIMRNPDDTELCVECAEALNAVMRIRTNSNTLHITRMLDTPANKRVWAKHGPRALTLAKRAKVTAPQNPHDCQRDGQRTPPPLDTSIRKRAHTTRMLC